MIWSHREGTQVTKKLVHIPRLNPELLTPYSQPEAGANVKAVSLAIFPKESAEGSKLGGVKGRHPCFPAQL